MSLPYQYQLLPLGDSALVIDFGNVIDIEINKSVVSLYYHFTNNPFPGMIEAAPAYSSLTLYYDLYALKKKNKGELVFDLVKQYTEKSLEQYAAGNTSNYRIINIPVCYDPLFGIDIELMALEKNISITRIVQKHISRTYHVFMLGFLPGFAYMGEVDPEIEMPRKPQPEQVEPGSVGIAGKQTGIYPMRSPGGWQIIGRTPLKMFDEEADPQVLLRAGDKVQFIPVSMQEYEQVSSGEKTWAFTENNS